MPTFPPSDAVAEHTEGTHPVAPVVLTVALIPPWTVSSCRVRLSNGGTVGGDSDYVLMPGNVTFQFDGTKPCLANAPYGFGPVQK